jgi:hypothetical protein
MSSLTRSAEVDAFPHGAIAFQRTSQWNSVGEALLLGPGLRALNR